MEIVCIYIEKYYFKEEFFPYIENFLNDLKNDFITYIFIPDIFVIKNIIKNPSIYDHLRELNYRVEKIEPQFQVDALIIFSDYDRGMYFDRRQLIVKAIDYKILFTINSNNFKNVINLKNINSVMLLNEINFMKSNEFLVENIFKTYNFNLIDRRNEFIEKYKLRKDKKIFGILSKKIEKSLLEKLSKEFNLVSTCLDNKLVTKVDKLDFICIISFSEEFISDNEYHIFLSNVTIKKIKIIEKENTKIINKSNQLPIPSVKFCIKNILQSKNDIKNNYYINRKNGN